jgi:hypothetical protein
LSEQKVHDPAPLGCARHELLRIQIEAQIDARQADALRLVGQAESGGGAEIDEAEITGERKDVAASTNPIPWNAPNKCARSSLFKTTTLLPPVGNPVVEIVPLVAEPIEREPAYGRIATLAKKRSLAGKPLIVPPVAGRFQQPAQAECPG